MQWLGTSGTLPIMTPAIRHSLLLLLLIVVSSPGWLLADQSESRFVLTLNDEAVLDSATGLVWEREPDYIFDAWERSIARCATKTVGGQQGWRAPSIDDIKTLVDPDQQDPALPPGHPFRNIKSGIYWTATPHPTDDIVAWQQSFLSGQAVTDQKSGMRRLWCVRGERR
ncbi:MAG: DUF1566 domain-containing protein [Nitrospira sp. NTP2]|nr:DUF1566 domain-containing protein [Nitrospira sp. NTP2]RIK61347.1 MAG: hypothetical protein DCC63_00990 [Nitrospira sp.]